MYSVYTLVTYGHWSVTGEALDCVPLLEMLDLSWNAGVGGGNLHCLTMHLRSASSLRELHLVDCQLSEADAVALGECKFMLCPCCTLNINNVQLYAKVDVLLMF